MFKKFIQKIGIMNFVMLLVVFSVIIVSEYMFLQGRKLDAIFVAFWAPTILGFMILFNRRN